MSKNFLKDVWKFMIKRAIPIWFGIILITTGIVISIVSGGSLVVLGLPIVLAGIALVTFGATGRKK